MKKITSGIFFIIMMLLSLVAEAQFERGRLLAGVAGSLNFNHFNTGANGIRENIITFDLETRGGVFIRRGFVGGLLFQGEYFSSYLNKETRLSGYHTLVGPFIRYYFRNHIFLAADAGIGSGRKSLVSAQPNLNFERQRDIYYGSIGLGYALMVGNNVAFEPLFHVDSTNDFNRDDVSDVVRRIRVRLSVGITVFLN